MKKSLFLTISMLISGNVFAATDHYVLHDDGFVRHLKVTQIDGEYAVSADIDFEASAKDHCSAAISGKAKSTAKDELLLKKHSESEASFCELKIKLGPNGAKIEESKGCDNFSVGKCHFSSGDKELIKVK
ncbi:MAG: hypothetical protein PHF31_04360 [Methylobacter sp.]|nr:hypothetical protein [Methylobacter sp.]